jgi:hypothetical protein
MKKLSILFAALAFSTAAFAQKGLELGLNIAPQNTWIFNQQDFDEGDNLNFRATIGYNVGANVGYNFTNSIGIRSGIGFSTQGQNYIDDNFDIPYAVKLNYLKVPVLVKFNSDPQSATAFLATMGVDMGFLAGGKATIDGEEIPNYDVKDDYNAFDLAAVIGLGLQARLTDQLNLNFMLRVSYSVMDIEKESAKPLGRESANHMIGGLQIGVNYVLFGEE